MQQEPIIYDTNNDQRHLYTLNILKKKFYFSLICLIAVEVGYTQNRDSTSHSGLLISGVAATAYVGSIWALSEIWYEDQRRDNFHFFNDNNEWMQMDKAGHFYSGYHISRASADILQSLKVDSTKSLYYGALAGFMLLLPIEVLDGYSDDYGASYGDVIANGAGSLLFLGQELLFQAPVIKPKFSFHRTGYPAYRKELLGENLSQQVVKDYNGQTYWLSVDMDKMFRQWPPWLNLAIGYGANDMVSASNESSISRGFNPYRQWFISLDPDLTFLYGENKWLNGLIYVLDLVKIPAPTIELSEGNLKGHWYYF